MLKTIATTRIAVIALAAGVSLWSLRADGQSVRNGSLMGGDTSGQSAAEARRHCDDLLGRARQAMAENNLDGAEQLLREAEALGVHYPALYLGDTPAKVRRDLDRQRQAQSRNPTLPSQIFNPLAGAKKKVPSSTPFDAAGADPATVLPDAKSVAKSYILRSRQELARGNMVEAIYWYQKAAAQPATFGATEDSPEKLAEDIRRMGGNLGTPAPAAPMIEPPAAGVDDLSTRLLPLPPVGQVTSMSPPVTASVPAAMSARQQSDMLLVEARRALALGDVRSARARVAQARSLNVAYGRLEDSPDRVETLINAYDDLMQQRAERGHTEGYRRLYAKLLMEQADGLLRWREFDEAERLADLAAKQNVTYGPFDVKPESLLERITAERRRSQGVPAAQSSGSEVLPSTAAKQQVMQLVRQAREAMAAGDLATAEALARQAQAIPLPETAFVPNEDRPALVLLDIQQARLGGAGVVPAAAQQVMPATGAMPYDRRAAPAVYDPATDRTWNMLAGSQQPGALPAAPATPFQEETPGLIPGAMPGMTPMTPGAPAPGAPVSQGMILVQQAEAALQNHRLVTGEPHEKSRRGAEPAGVAITNVEDVRVEFLEPLAQLVQWQHERAGQQ